MKIRALWWWIDRWRKSTAYTDMTLEEQGAYRNLLDDAALRGGPLPNDEHVLAKACGDPRCWRRVRTKVIAHFTLEADGWHNATLDAVLRESERRATKQQQYRQRTSNTTGNGIGNASGNGGSNKVHLLETETVPSSVVRSSSEGDSQGETDRLDVAFRQFQAKYPESRRKGGRLIEESYLHAAHSAGGPGRLLEALTNHLASEQWQTPKLIPGMDMWLEKEQWRQRLNASSAPAAKPTALDRWAAKHGVVR